MTRTPIILSGLLSTALVIGVAAHADDVKNSGAHPTHDQLIQSLLPSSNDPQIKTRGIRVLSTKPGSLGTEGMGQAHDDKAPAVSVAIKFAINSSDLTDEAKTTVQEIAKAMTSDQLGTYRFKLEGHTDSTGSADLNLDLSKRRAELVKDTLVAQYHVDPSRLQTEGVGSNDPIDASDPTASVNRRVQIVNLGPK